MKLKLSHAILILVFQLVNCSFLYAQQVSVKVKHRLIEIEKLYNTDEREALAVVNSALEPNEVTVYSVEEHLSLLRWKVEILYKIPDINGADVALKTMFKIKDDIDYEKFTNKSQHFKSFYNAAYAAYDKGFVFVNKYKEDVATAPATITVYGRSDLEELGFRDLVDLLKLTPGFSEVGDDNERNIGTRGTYGTTVQHILILINGHQINDLLTSSNAPDWLSLDYVEQVEVMRGPGSALYGGNAFSGVINIITKSGKTFDENKLSVQTGSAQLFDENTTFRDHQYKLNYQFGTRFEKTRDKLYFSGTVRYSGGSRYTNTSSQFDIDDPQILPDIRTQDTIAANMSGTEYINRYLPSYNFLVNYISDRIDATINAQSSTLGIYRPSSGNIWNSNDLQSTRTRHRKDNREFIKINYDLLGSSSSGNSMSLDLSFDHFLKDIYTNNFANFNADPADTSAARLRGDEYRLQMSLEYDTEKWSFFKDSTGNKNKSVTMMGLQSNMHSWFYNYMISVENEAEFTYNPSQNFFDNQKNKENTLAFFFQTTQHIIDQRLLLTAGFRLNYNPIYSDFTQFRYGDEISPRLSLVYLSKTNAREFTPLKLKLLYNSAFLPPAFLYRRGGIVGFNAQSNLNSQKIESLEFNVFGEVNKNLTYSINTYVNKIDQFLVRVNNIYQNSNIARRVSGWELTLEHVLGQQEKDWSAKSFLYLSSASMQTNDGGYDNILEALIKKNYSDSILTYYPRFSLAGGIQGSYRLPKSNVDKLQFGLSFNYQGLTPTVASTLYNEDTDQWDTALSINKNVERTLPIFNINARLVREHFTYGFNVRNLLNTEYMLASVVSRTGQMLGEKQTILLSVEYKFGRQ